MKENQTELKELVKTAGAETVAVVIQNRERPHPGTYLGKGKIEELITKYADHENLVKVILNKRYALRQKITDKLFELLDNEMTKYYNNKYSYEIKSLSSSIDKTRSYSMAYLPLKNRFINLTYDKIENELIKTENKSNIKVVTQMPNILEAPINQNQKIGTVKVTLNDKVIKQYNIYAAEEIKKINFGFCFCELLKAMTEL